MFALAFVCSCVKILSFLSMCNFAECMYTIPFGQKPFEEGLGRIDGTVAGAAAPTETEKAVKPKVGHPAPRSIKQRKQHLTKLNQMKRRCATLSSDQLDLIHLGCIARDQLSQAKLR